MAAQSALSVPPGLQAGHFRALYFLLWPHIALGQGQHEREWVPSVVQVLFPLFLRGPVVWLYDPLWPMLALRAHFLVRSTLPWVFQPFPGDFGPLSDRFLPSSGRSYDQCPPAVGTRPQTGLRLFPYIFIDSGGSCLLVACVLLLVISSSAVWGKVACGVEWPSITLLFSVPIPMPVKTCYQNAAEEGVCFGGAAQFWLRSITEPVWSNVY